MAPDSVDVRTQMEVLKSRLGELEGRVRALENQAPALGSSIPIIASATSPTIVSESPRVADVPLLPPGVLALTGRTLVVLGGAFLLRALTDEKLLPAFGGIAAGLMYAAFWLLRADADARAESRLSAAFHGLTALGVAYPIVLETTLRFRLIGPKLAGLLLVVCFCGGLLISERRQLRALAWANAILAAAATLVLLVGTRDLLPLSASLLVIGALIESRALCLAGPRAVVALAADLGVAISVIIASMAGGPPEGYAPLPLASVVVVALLLPTLYVGKAALRTLRDAQPLGLFTMLQAPLALLIGFGGAASVLSVANAPTWPLGGAASLLALGCYLAAFAVIDRRADQAPTFYAYTTLALALAFGGLGEILAGERLALAFGTLGILVLALAERYQRQTLRFHGLAYLAASASAGGLLGVAWNGLVTDPRAAWHPTTWLAGFGLLMLALGYALLWRCGASDSASIPTRLPPLLAASMLVTSSAGFVAMGLAGILALAPGPEADAARVAAIRTVVIAALGIGLAASGTRWRRKELVALA